MTASDVDAAVTDAITLIDQLVEVLVSENKTLSRGFPASLIDTTARKNELGEAFEQWVAAVRNQRIDLTAANDELRDEMISRSHTLHAAVDENINRLRGAIDASRRRLDAVLRAVRDERAGNSPYGADGRPQCGATAIPSLRPPLSI
ncbi:flagellar protein FlgN [Blastochloris viridis]|nr:flagellar protein FlgN [Blastochloris viridis]BAR98657.1 hypothetical protein BV133_1064 [Blastochloris viridis]